MKKRFGLILIAAMLLLALLAGCAKQPQELPQEQPQQTQTQQEQEQSQEPEQSQEQTDAPSETAPQEDAYAQILQSYAQAMAKQMDMQSLIDAALPTLLLEEGYDDAPQQIGYCIADFGGDAGEELLIAQTPDGGQPDSRPLVLALYFLDENGTAQQAFCSAARDRFVYCAGNVFAEYASDGFAASTQRFGHFDGSAFRPDETLMVRVDAQSVPLFTYSAGDESFAPISEDAAGVLQQKYEQMFTFAELTPFAQYEK